MIQQEEARRALPNSTVGYFDDIVFSRVLGAGKQTKLICKMLASIYADEADELAEAKKKAALVIDYFKATRGQNSRAIYNALNEIDTEVTKRLNSDPPNRQAAIEWIEKYEQLLAVNTAQAAEYAATLCEPMETIMIFDYSSTVNEFVVRLKSKKTIIIPESRALDGGRPFLKDAVKAGHNVRFIPDTTMLVALKSTQAVFIGAETIYPDGSVFNTVGADILAVLCHEYKIPFYVISPLIKTDVRNAYGYTKLAPMEFDYSVRLAKDWSDQQKQGIDFHGIKLVKIEAGYITALITENGIIPAYAFYPTALAYNERLEGKIC